MCRFGRLFRPRWPGWASVPVLLALFGGTVSRPAAAQSYTVNAGPSAVAPGGAITVRWTAPSGRPATDWVGLYEVGDPDDQAHLLWWEYTGGGTSGASTTGAPGVASQYQFRYFLEDGFTRVAQSNTVTVSAALPSAELRPVTPELGLPRYSDSNNPSFWADDRLHVFMSAGHPYRAVGKDIFAIAGQREEDTAGVIFSNEVNGGRWMEAIIRADDGTLYGFYHNEPIGVCDGSTLTAPLIGAAKSADNGLHWQDLGFVLEARPGTLRCDAMNGFFAGGNGDFSVILDAGYLYFFYSSYAGAITEQGVAVARMDWRDRDAPAGEVWKWYNGGFTQPGLGGLLTPTFQPFVAWEREDYDSFWGASVHWNTYLNQYVMLLNRAHNAGNAWDQEGIYISYSTKLADPRSWSEPRKIHAGGDGGTWYPHVLGDTNIRGTDKLAGQVARFFLGHGSNDEIIFTRPSDAVYLSDLAWISAANGWGSVEKDMSLGDLAAGDGGPITLDGKPYSKGLGAHAYSDIVYHLGDGYRRFIADVGVDDEVGDRGSVVFEVWADGAKIFDSGLLTGGSPAPAVNVSVAGKQQLRLIVRDAGDGIEGDVADWAGARLIP